MKCVIFRSAADRAVDHIKAGVELTRREEWMKASRAFLAAANATYKVAEKETNEEKYSILNIQEQMLFTQSRRCRFNAIGDQSDARYFQTAMQLKPGEQTSSPSIGVLDTYPLEAKEPLQFLGIDIYGPVISPPPGIALPYWFDRYVNKFGM